MFKLRARDDPQMGEAISPVRMSYRAVSCWSVRRVSTQLFLDVGGLLQLARVGLFDKSVDCLGTVAECMDAVDDRSLDLMRGDAEAAFLVWTGVVEVDRTFAASPRATLHRRATAAADQEAATEEVGMADRLHATAIDAAAGGHERLDSLEGLVIDDRWPDQGSGLAARNSPRETPGRNNGRAFSWCWCRNATLSGNSVRGSCGQVSLRARRVPRSQNSASPPAAQRGDR